MKISKSKINKLIDVSNNRCGIDIHYITNKGEKGQIVGSKKERVIECIQQWFKSGEMTSATIISIHGKNTIIDFINDTINGEKII